MKRKLFCLNSAMIIPYMLVAIGLLPFKFVVLLALLVSILNVCFANTVKNLILNDLILFLCSIAGIVLDYFVRKNYGVGFHTGIREKYQWLIGFFVLCSSLIIGIEVVLKYLLDRKR